MALCEVDLLGSTMLHRDRWAESRAKTAAQGVRGRQRESQRDERDVQLKLKRKEETERGERLQLVQGKTRRKIYKNVGYISSDFKALHDQKD